MQAKGAVNYCIKSLKKFGIDKVPQKSAIENNGSYFYNMVQFRQI